MKKRNVFAVFILPFVTFGIYAIVWYVSTKEEMNAKGAQIPTAWLLIIPFVNLYWLWVYAKGVEKVTNGACGAMSNFLLRLFLGPIGMAITQNAFNKVAV
jgi:hypothetical protein